MKKSVSLDSSVKIREDYIVESVKGFNKGNVFRCCSAGAIILTSVLGCLGTSSQSSDVRGGHNSTEERTRFSEVKDNPKTLDGQLTKLQKEVSLAKYNHGFSKIANVMNSGYLDIDNSFREWRNQTLVSSCEKYKNVSEEKESQIVSLQNQSAIMINEKGELENRIVALKESVNRVETNNLRLQADVERLKNVSIGNADNIESLKQELELKSSEVISVRDELAKSTAILNAKVEQIEAEKQALIEQRSELESSLKQKDADIDSLKEELASKNADITRLEFARETFVQEVDKMVLCDKQLHNAMIVFEQKYQEATSLNENSLKELMNDLFAEVHEVDEEKAE